LAGVGSFDDGAPGQPFCRSGSWVSDPYSGATLTLFANAGRAVGDPNHWNNRHISRRFVPASDYSGDIRIGFIRSAQPYRPMIAISHLPNGIHGLQCYSNGAWHAATAAPTRVGATRSPPRPRRRRRAPQYRSRVVDASDAPLAGGRACRFSLPPSCATGCGPARAAVTCTTS
jgi:hypothetical protein